MASARLNVRLQTVHWWSRSSECVDSCLVSACWLEKLFLHVRHFILTFPWVERSCTRRLSTLLKDFEQRVQWKRRDVISALDSSVPTLDEAVALLSVSTNDRSVAVDLFKRLLFRISTFCIFQLKWNNSYVIEPAWKVLTLFLLRGLMQKLAWKMRFRLFVDEKFWNERLKNISFCFYSLFKFLNNCGDFFCQINEKLIIGIISFLLQSIQKTHNMHPRKCAKIPGKNRWGGPKVSHAQTGLWP